jgi:hypothetical protein
LKVAAELAGVPLPEVHALVRDGKVRSERIKHALFVDLDDVEAYARTIAEEAPR